MNFEDYLRGYENALKMPHESYHEYCMKMREASSMEERRILQLNYRCLLLAAELHQKKTDQKKSK